MQARADTRRADVSFDVGQEVLLSTRNLSFKGPGCRKLLPRWVGPFKVAARVGPVAYRLDLLPTMRIHPVFHVSLLRPYVSDGRVQPPPVATLEGEEEFEVERILDHRSRHRNKTEFLVRWSGYGPEHDTWEPEEGLVNAPEILREYWRYVGRGPTRPAKRRRGSRDA
jgi:hypothetical protein